MSDTPTPAGPAANVPIETLLAHEGWVCGLARSLVLDDARAADVVQETWLTALREPPRATGSVRGWLASVVRSRAADARKADRRRDVRERAVSRPEAAGVSVADAAAATETHRRLVDAVMSLDEPYRSAVILRFFEGLPPREVGERTGVPAETARTRVNRGVDRLRERLDADYGDRRRWTVLLVPIAALGDSGPEIVPSNEAAGGMAMTTAKTAVFAGIAVALMIGAWWWFHDGGASAQAGGSAAGPPVRTADAAAAKPARIRPVPETAATETAAPVEVAPPPPPAPAAGALVRLRFVDENGAPLPQETVRQRWGGGVVKPALALVDDRALRGTAGNGWLVQVAAGAGQALRRVSLEESADGVCLRDRVPKGRWRVVAFPGISPSTASRTFTVGTDGDEMPVDIVLAATPMRVVRLVDEANAGIAGATVVPRFEFGDDAVFVEGEPFTADAAGECRLPVEVANARTYQRAPTWWATAPGRAASFQVAPDANAVAPLVVKLTGTCDIEGDAYLGDGTPAAGRTVRWRKKGLAIAAVCDAEGRFRLAGIPPRKRLQIYLVEDVARQAVIAALVDGKPGTTVHVRIGTPAAVETGRLVVRVTAGGRPVSGAALRCDVGESNSWFAATGSDGEGVLAGLPAGVPAKASVLISDARVSDGFSAEPREFAPLAPGEERKLALDLPAGVVRVRVVDAAGGPVPSARVSARAADKDAASPAGWNVHAGYGSFAGDDGVATLVGLPVGGACDVQVFDDVTGLQGKANLVPGTWDAPGEVTVTLAK